MKRRGRGEEEVFPFSLHPLLVSLIFFLYSFLFFRFIPFIFVFFPLGFVTRFVFLVIFVIFLRPPHLFHTASDSFSFSIFLPTCPSFLTSILLAPTSSCLHPPLLVLCSWSSAAPHQIPFNCPGLSCASPFL